MSDNGWKQMEESAEKRRQSRRQAERSMGAETEGFRLNDLMLASLVLIAAVISFTDFTFSFGDLRNLTALTLFLYIITVFVYRNRYEMGKRKGQADGEYRSALLAYREKRQSVYDRNLAGRMADFCTAYKKRELREYRESLLCDIEMTYGEYRETYLRMSEREIMRLKLSGEAKRILIKCNRARSVRLTPGMLLNESGEAKRHRLLGQSGRERERADKKREAVSRAVYVLFGAVVAVDVIFHFSFLTVAQWIVRMLPVVIAVITGDDAGFSNVTVTETAFKQSQLGCLGLFEEWLAGEEETPPPSNNV